MATTYIWPNIRALLLEGFSESELRQFCFDVPNFRPLYPQLAQHSSLADLVQQVLAYAERTSQAEILLAWAKEHNPAQFENHQPYRSDQPAHPSHPPLSAPHSNPATSPVPPPSPQFDYHVFVSYSRADREWVQVELLPYLEAAGLKVCIDFRDFAPAAPLPTEVERAILSSQKTLLVLTPDYLESEWAEFGNLMLQALDPASRERRLVPLLKAPCNLPPRLSFLIPIDFVDPPDEAMAWSQLVTTLGGRLAGPPPVSPWQTIYRQARRFLHRGAGLLISLVTLGLLAVVTLLLVRPTPAPSFTATAIPPMAESGFNIAVAEFALAGQAATEPDLARAGWYVGSWLADGIKEEKILYPTIHATVREPDKVAIIAGEDRERRAANAARYAEENNVNILIYGVITGSHNSYFVEPEFYVSWRGFDYGSEVIGSDQLGGQEPIYPPFDDPARNALNNKLMSRRRVLHHVIYGLGYFYYSNNENHYYIDAYEEFEAAAREEAGKDLAVVHLLKGAAKMREYQASCQPFGAALIQAESAFTRSFQLNQSYARSYLGLGSIALEQAKIFNEDCTRVVEVHANKLVEAKNWYSNSLSAATQPQLAYVPVKAYYGLGQVHLLGIEHQLPGWSRDDARLSFQRVISGYTVAGKPAALTEFAGNAHANLAWLAGFDKNWPIILSECDQAIDLLTSLPAHRSHRQISYCYAWSAMAFQEQGELEKALAAFGQAIQLGQASGVLAEDLEAWQTRLDLLAKEIP